MQVSASQLYNYYQCPHKIWQDKFGPKEEEIQETNPFVQLLWDKGVQHEEKVVSGLYGTYVDLSQGTITERIQKTNHAIAAKEKLLYQPVLSTQGLYGIPDLLELQPDGTYLPIDIKSGMGFEGQTDDSEGQQKKHYALQLCMYVDILTSMSLCSSRQAFIIDGDGVRVTYELDKVLNARTGETFWQYYEQTLHNVTQILSGAKSNEPAMAGVCKLCSWYYVCKKWCSDHDDPTQLFYLGRSVRDKLKTEIQVSTVADVAVMDVADLLARKKADKSFLKGLGDSTLQSAKRRAEMFLQKTPPVAYTPITLPVVAYELFFDIEDDPTQDFVYLHGIYVRENGKEYFKDFTADHISPAAEEKAWKDFWDYIHSLAPGSFAVYYYSSHEKTIYFKLQKKYPGVISEEALKSFFENQNVIDLYSVVLKQTDWPLGSYSIKELATYLGFKWRDATPSGALSIQWFNEYIRDRDPKQLQRILEYNEDDCKATMVLKDGLVKM